MRHIASTDGFHRFSAMLTISILRESELSPREKFRKLRSDANNVNTKRRALLAQTGGGPAPPPPYPIHDQIVAVVLDEALVGLVQGK